MKISYSCPINYSICSASCEFKIHFFFKLLNVVGYINKHSLNESSMIRIYVLIVFVNFVRCMFEVIMHQDIVCLFALDTFPRWFTVNNVIYKSLIFILTFNCVLKFNRYFIFLAVELWNLICVSCIFLTLNI